MGWERGQGGYDQGDYPIDRNDFGRREFGRW